MSSINTRIGELKLQLTSKNSGLDAATAELETTKHRLCFAKDAASVMWEQVQSEAPQLGEEKAAWAAAESSIQSLTVSEYVLRGVVGLFIRCVVELEEEVSRVP